MQIGDPETGKFTIEKIKELTKEDLAIKFAEYFEKQNIHVSKEQISKFIEDIAADNNIQDGIVEISNKITDIRSALEPSYFNLLDPFSDIPIIAILSGSILLILLSIQCLNFIIIRLLLIKFAPQIEKLLINKQFFKKWIGYVIEAAKRVSLFYYVAFTICIYVSLLMTVYYLYTFLSIVSSYY